MLQCCTAKVHVQVRLHHTFAYYVYVPILSGIYTLR